MVPSVRQVQLAKKAGRLTVNHMHAESALSTSGKRLADSFASHVDFQKAVCRLRDAFVAELRRSGKTANAARQPW